MPEHIALLLKEGLRESSRLLSDDQESDLKAWLRDATKEAEALESALRDPKSDANELETRFRSIQNSCRACHRRFRN